MNRQILPNVVSACIANLPYLNAAAGESDKFRAALSAGYRYQDA
jgi:hypothetical protein